MTQVENEAAGTRFLRVFLNNAAFGFYCPADTTGKRLIFWVKQP
jgi:hypothetical protein